MLLLEWGDDLLGSGLGGVEAAVLGVGDGVVGVALSTMHSRGTVPVVDHLVVLNPVVVIVVSVQVEASTGAKVHEVAARVDLGVDLAAEGSASALWH